MAGKNANGEGSVFQRKRDGKWVCEIVLGWDADGKRKTLRYSADTRKEVQDWRIKRLGERQGGILADPSRETVSEFLGRWLDTTACHSIKPRTLVDYQDLVDRYITPAIGSTALQKLRPDMIQNLYHARLKAGLSPRTVQLIHAVLRRGLQQALEWSLIPRNPADVVKKPRVVRKQVVALEPDQVARLLKAAREDRLHSLWVLAISTGLRQGELLGLRWSDVDLAGGTLKVSQTLVRQKGPVAFGSPKTESSRRTLDLPGMTLAALKQWRRVQGEERLRLGKGWAFPDLIFTTGLGTPLNPSNLRKYLNRLLEDAECPHVRFHDLRHTAATLMLVQGVQAKVVQEVLGHADIRMTLGTYSHVIREQKKDAAQMMDNFLAAADKA